MCLDGTREVQHSGSASMPWKIKQREINIFQNFIANFYFFFKLVVPGFCFFFVFFDFCKISLLSPLQQMLPYSREVFLNELPKLPLLSASGRTVKQLSEGKKCLRVS